MDYLKIPCAIIRGGTSKGVFFNDKDLPIAPETRDKVILSAFGSPDSRQVDGLGGADPLTSKVAIIKRSNKPGVDIDYTFGQVGINEASVNYSLNCGNMASGAAIFAIDEGLVRVEEPVTTVRMFETNTKSLISAIVCVKDGKAAATGDYSIDGVHGKGSMITLRFLNTIGAITGELLPTGNSLDRVSMFDGRDIEVSVVDAGNLYLFIAAKDLYLNGDESPEDIEQNINVIGKSKEIFELCSRMVNKRMGFKKDINIQKMAIVSEAKGDNREGADIVSRIISSNGKVHKAYAVTGAISAGSAAHIEGSVVRRAFYKEPEGEIRIAHPQGVIDIEIEKKMKDGRSMPDGAIIRRTARRIMDGSVYIKI